MPGASIMTSPRDTSRLENLSTELKCAILENAPDFHSLRNLVHASPGYHAAYLSAREAILTRVTFRELWNRSIDLSSTTALVQICHVGGAGKPVSLDVKWTLRRLRRHETGLQALRTIRGSVILDVEQCCSLLALGSVVWKPFVCLEDETKLSPNYPSHCFTDEGYKLQGYKGDEGNDGSGFRNMDAGWDAYYLDDVGDGCMAGLDQLILRHTEFFLLFPGTGQWWNLVS